LAVYEQLLISKFISVLLNWNSWDIFPLSALVLNHAAIFVQNFFFPQILEERILKSSEASSSENNDSAKMEVDHQSPTKEQEVFVSVKLNSQFIIIII
jgi:hypothetical protein